MNKELQKRILQISYERKLSHIGSCLSAVDIIDAIYEVKKPEEKFVLSAGHSGIALYAVLEKLGILKDIDKLNVHPDRGEGVDCSTGSLGQGLPIAVGMALADRSKNVYCMISDGECAEGSIWEALRIGYEQNLTNLKLVINANGWSAYDRIDLIPLVDRFRAFGWGVLPINGHNKKALTEALKTEVPNTPFIIFAKTMVEHFDFLKGLDAHYHTVTKEEHESIQLANN